MMMIMMIMMMMIIVHVILRINLGKPHYKWESVTVERTSPSYHRAIFPQPNIEARCDLCCPTT